MRDKCNCVDRGTAFVVYQGFAVEKLVFEGEGQKDKEYVCEHCPELRVFYICLGMDPNP